MNLKAAKIAWLLAMEHNRLHKALTAVCKADDEEYDVLKKRFFRSMYRYIVRILETPDTTDEHFKEFLSRTLDEKEGGSHDEGSSDIHSRSDLGANTGHGDKSRREGWLRRIWRR